MDDKKENDKDIIRLYVETIEFDPATKYGKPTTRPCPYQVGDIYMVKKSACEKYHRQSHPRRWLYEVPILSVVDTDNGIEFWVSQGQLRSLLAE